MQIFRGGVIVKNYIKPTICNVELRPEEGLACYGSKATNNVSSVGWGSNFNFSSFDWEAFFGSIKNWFKW